MDNAKTEGKLTSRHAKRWILNRWDPVDRPLIIGHLTTEWASAVTVVQNKVLDTPTATPITNAPVLFIASLGDNVLQTEESEQRLPRISGNYTQVILTYNSHDVAQSVTPELNYDAIAAISDWLGDPVPTHSGSSTDRSGATLPRVGKGCFLAFLGLFLATL